MSDAAKKRQSSRGGRLSFVTGKEGGEGKMLKLTAYTISSTISPMLRISINQFITLAAAEKVAALDTMRFFEERTNRADLARFRQILNRPGGEPPQPGDELPG